MRKLFAWLGVATLAVVIRAPAAEAAPNDPLKPFIILDLDTSGSMGEATGSGPPSCGGPDTKLNHARCAISNIIESYGDIVIGLARFRMSMSGTTTAATFPSGCSTAQAFCDTADHEFELLSALVDGNNAAGDAWVNLSGNTCTATGTDPEIWLATGNTPIEGTLRGSKRYWQGLQATDGTQIWPSGQPGFDPIRNDPTKTSFIPTGCNPAPTCTVNCCATQCRPYIVIMLTDGDETCGGTPPNAAASLLQTDVDSRRYRVLTKPIGFGIAPGNANIEALAHAGGAVDVAGVNEGFYASDAAGLQLAISNIIAGSIRTESCNSLDDDCDGAIDEDFPGKGNACDNGKLGVCKATGNLVCRADGTGLQCNAPAGPAPGTEVCNGLDDDCDGKVDEGLTGCTCVPQAEICDGLDNDCDGKIDEGPITRPCGVGTCQGTETCVAGVFTGCTAQTPTTEICDGLDNDCDGQRDGFVDACSNMPPNGHPAGDPANNPGDPSNNPIAQNVCHPGTKTCPANVGPPNSFGPCLGEKQPGVEVCNGLDDDCDNKIDEGTGGQDCSTNCGVGTTACVNGQIVCNSTVAPNDPTCDGIDDDCDGQVDEEWVCSNPGMGCACNNATTCNGVEKCIGGHVVCDGTPIGQEVCDCRDQNCNGVNDDGAQCLAGQSCTADCQCAPPCDPGEIKCGQGRTCHDNFCIIDPCWDPVNNAPVMCPDVPGVKQVCIPVFHTGMDPPTMQCVSACSQAQCSPAEVCIEMTGECAPNNCITFPDQCSADQNCINGTCVTNPCKNVDCPADQYCVGGECHGSCADVDCPEGERCKLGMCEADPCKHPCPGSKVCKDDTGTCVDNPCDVVDCPKGQWCNPNHNGACEDDPCVGTKCPSDDQVCVGGTCYDPGQLQPNPEDEQHVTTGGGGGCSTGGGASIVAGLALLALTQRRRKGAAS